MALCQSYAPGKLKDLQMLTIASKSKPFTSFLKSPKDCVVRIVGFIRSTPDLCAADAIVERSWDRKSSTTVKHASKAKYMKRLHM